MDRTIQRYGTWLATLSLLAAGISTSGCGNIMATAMYVLDGTDVQAEFEGLRGKRVAVVCRPPATLAYASAAHELAEEVGIRLSNQVSKIEVIDQQEVSVWTDENSWDDFAEIGRALKADIVIGIDLEDFSLYQHQTLYQGKASVGIRVYDLENNGKIVYKKIPPQSVFPPNAGIPTQEKPEAEFRRQYVGELADEISKNFYDHDSRADFAKDSTALF